MGLTIKRIFFYIFLLVIFISCRTLKSTFNESEILNNHFTGFVLMDPVNKEFIYLRNADKYFTPASNTKIFTMYAALTYLPDSVPGLYYLETEDTVVFWGSGDPSLLNPDVYQSDRVFNFLRKTNKTLVYSDANYYDDHFGPGWAWDDYNDYYSVEKFAFPLYGNYVRICTDSLTGNLIFEPAYFENFLYRHNPDTAKPVIRRNINDNIIHYYGLDSVESIDKIIPFKNTPELFTQLLSDTLKRQVAYDHIPFREGLDTLYNMPLDSLLKPMMANSDNFIAEQLLLLCAGKISDSIKSQITIDALKKEHLSDLPDGPKWVDGSGLSRYNLFTPRSIVDLWNRIYSMMPEERLFGLLASGGKSGTLKDWYVSEPPFIYGKTGSLRNNHCLSGFLITKSGKRLIFSFMNNNYTIDSSLLKNEMDRILRFIHDHN